MFVRIEKPSLLVHNPGSPEFWGFPPIVVRPRQLANNSINTRPKYYSPLLSSTSAFYWDNFQCSLRFLSFLCFFLMFTHPADSTAGAALPPEFDTSLVQQKCTHLQQHWFPPLVLFFFLNIWVFSIPPRPLMVKLMINPSINQVMVNLFTINLVKTQLDGVFPSTLQSLQVDRHRRQVEFSISIIEVHPLGRSAVLRWAEEQSLVALKWPRKNGGLSHLKWRFFNHGVQNGIEWFISGEFWWYLIFWFLFSIHIFFDICLVSFSQRKWENDP